MIDDGIFIKNTILNTNETYNTHGHDTHIIYPNQTENPSTSSYMKLNLLSFYFCFYFFNKIITEHSSLRFAHPFFTNDRRKLH